MPITAGWLEKKWTDHNGGPRYWYHRWRERDGDKIIRRSRYISPVKEGEHEPSP